MLYVHARFHKSIIKYIPAKLTECSALLAGCLE